LGLSPPVTPDELTSAFRARIAKAHPDLHIASAERSDAANTLTRALNDARAVVSEWIGSGRDWPATAASSVTTPSRGATISFSIFIASTTQSTWPA
jgi:hypothetical protein